MIADQFATYEVPEPDLKSDATRMTTQVKKFCKKKGPGREEYSQPGPNQRLHREEQIIGTQDEAQKLVAQRLLVILHCLDSTNSS